MISHALTTRSRLRSAVPRRRSIPSSTRPVAAAGVSVTRTRPMSVTTMACASTGAVSATVRLGTALIRTALPTPFADAGVTVTSILLRPLSTLRPFDVLARMTIPRPTNTPHPFLVPTSPTSTVPILPYVAARFRSFQQSTAVLRTTADVAPIPIHGRILRHLHEGLPSRPLRTTPRAFRPWTILPTLRLQRSSSRLTSIVPPAILLTVLAAVLPAAVLPAALLLAVLTTPTIPVVLPTKTTLTKPVLAMA